ncbi:UNVERIFIED_CONTAM: hypothetical protein GTU68_049191 [Idotea baltica]|nr:hypothetical protein [Idotea baltica]
MKILVANLGSTSFKYRLFDLADESQLARGGIDRIGEANSSCNVQIGDHESETTRNIPDHAAAVGICLEQLTDPEHGCLSSVNEVAAIGFKAVFAGNLSGVRRVDEQLLSKMEELADIAPAHNPPYATAMRQLSKAFPDIPLVAALETGFHDTIPEEHRIYAVPYEWKQKFDVQRWGFHGASHRYIGTRMADLLGRDDAKVISCHLGGSASVCAIKGGQSFATSMGMSPQTGLPHNNRVGDFDPFALPVLMRASGKSMEQLLEELANQSGLLGISGVSGDVRDLESAATDGNQRAELALRVFESSIRSLVGSYMSLLGGTDAVVFTGGIGENSRRIRSSVCRDMEWCGLVLDEPANDAASGESRISSSDSKVDVWVVPTNEEIIVARQTAETVKR